MGETRIFPATRPANGSGSRQPARLPNCLPMAQVCSLGVSSVVTGLTAAARRLTEMARQYGDLYSLKIINSTVIVLSSITAIREIMDRNSAIVSDRPVSHFAQEITGGNHIGASRYSRFVPVSENNKGLIAFRRSMASSQEMCSRNPNTNCMQKPYKYSAGRSYTAIVRHIDMPRSKPNVPSHPFRNNLPRL